MFIKQQQIDLISTSYVTSKNTKLKTVKPSQKYVHNTFSLSTTSKTIQTRPQNANNKKQHTIYPNHNVES